MKITIKKVDTPINIIRKCKINKINGDKNIDSIYYNCKCQPENEFKDIRDFHLFCLSISMELIDNSAKTNEFGEINYIKLTNSKNTVLEIKNLFEHIANDKKNNPYKYKIKK